MFADDVSSAEPASRRKEMTIVSLAGRAGRILAFGTAIVALIGFTTPQPAHALGTGAAVGIGLGALAVGTALGAAANPYPYAAPYPYPTTVYPPGYYYGPAQPTYPAYSSCWSPVYGRYVPC
jgi:hypothetical protein